MNPEDFKSKASKFISGSSSRNKFTIFGTSKFTKISGIIPKRSIPSQVLKPTQSPEEEEATASRTVVSSLGRLTLDLEVINNNLDRIKEVIVNDYKETQETNKKEIEEYRKRVANRGRIFGKKELGDKKTDVLGTVRKYVGSFFSGTGGAIRALAAFNLLQGILSGDPSKIIGPLLGIGLTYLPAIGAGIGGAVAKSLVGKLFGGIGKTAATGVAEGAGAAAGLGRFSRFGGRAALVGAGLGLASSIFNKPEENTQQRLEQLTQEQKGLVDPQNLGPIHQDDLKRFESLNKRFEAALDFLLGKEKEQPQQTSSAGGGGGAPPGPLPNPYDIPNLNVTPGSVPTLENFKKSLQGTPMAAEAESMYNMALSEGLNPAFVTGLAGAESSFGTAGKAVGRNNPFNYGVNNNQTYGSYTESVQALARALRNPQGPYAGKKTLQDIISTYSPAVENDVAQHIKNIMTIGSKSGGDPATLFIPRGFRGTQAPPLPSPSVTPTILSRGSMQQPQQTPQVNVVPFTVPSGQTSQSSNAVEGNDVVIDIDTTYTENLFTLYSKLVYQIV